MASPLNLIVYHSPLFAAHRALFLPSPTNNMIGKRIHADGSPATGFEVIFEEYDLTGCTQSYETIHLGEVKIGDLEHTARSVEAPRNSLIPASEKVHIRTCYRDSGFETKQPLMLIGTEEAH
jgi:hypothetical protein